MKKNLRLVTSGVMIALAFVLSLLKPFDLPFGGSVTLFSMVPIVLLGCMYGVKWGLFCGTVNGILQALMGAFGASKAFAGLGALEIVLMCFLDYIAAFAVIGLGGIFVSGALKKQKSIVGACALGAFVATALRYLVHFISGAILFGGYAEWFFTEKFVNRFGNWILDTFSGTALSVVYSLVYNGLYMIPEIIITVAGTALLLSCPPIKKRVLDARQ